MITAERGSVTAEFAVLFPTLLLCAVGFLQLGAIQFDRAQLLLTTGSAVRAASHLMSHIEVQNLVTRMSPGARVSLTQDADVICAEVTKPSIIPLVEKLCTRVQGQ